MENNICSNKSQDPGSGSLPCLNSNNYTENSVFDSVELTPYRRKQAFTLIENCDRFIDLVGIDRVGFLTLTFPDNVLEHSDALRRWNSLRTHFIDHYFGRWMLVKERQRRGAIHYHILIEVPFDLRSGFNFDEAFPPRGKRANYRSACQDLRNIWQELRSNLPKYGFGRSELAPIRSNGEAMAKYVGKYLSKDTGPTNNKHADLDHGARMTAYSQNWSRSNCNFAWNSPGAKEWRKKVAKFAEELGLGNELGLRIHLGPKWAYRFKDEIMKMEIENDS